jgi:hypothetical protein
MRRVGARARARSNACDASDGRCARGCGAWATGTATRTRGGRAAGATTRASEREFETIARGVDGASQIVFYQPIFERARGALPIAVEHDVVGDATEHVERGGGAVPSRRLL